jgi:ATP-dependent RNA helicase DHX29
MAKKKRTQLKPVSRGFAVVSQPKKLVVEDDVSGDADVVVEESSTSESGRGSEHDPPIQRANDSFIPDKSAEMFLQNILDRLQDRTEKEVRATPFVKVLAHKMDPGVKNSEGITNS